MDMYTYAYASPYAIEDILTPVPMGRYPNVIVPYLPTVLLAQIIILCPNFPYSVAPRQAACNECTHRQDFAPPPHKDSNNWVK